MTSSNPEHIDEASHSSSLAQRHLFLGWLGLTLVIVLGIALELLHAFKAPLYLDAAHEGRRLMWRLAHAHAGLLALLQFAFVASLPYLRERQQKISRLLLGGSLLLPLGFFLGGLGARGGDPSFGILLVPVGALLLLLACGLLVWALRRQR